MADKKIDVLLNTSKKPNVRVDSMVWGKSKLVWAPDPDSDPFIFSDLVFKKKSNPFGTPEIKDKKITVDNPKFDRADGEGEWVYTITVKVGEASYNTDEPGPPGDDKPVIRN
jgi:hypothetical protein